PAARPADASRPHPWAPPDAPQACMTGSSAVVKPPAGRIHSISPSLYRWMYGSRFATTISLAPPSRVRATFSNRSLLQPICLDLAGTGEGGRPGDFERDESPQSLR